MNMTSGYCVNSRAEAPFSKVISLFSKMLCLPCQDNNKAQLTIRKALDFLMGCPQYFFYAFAYFFSTSIDGYCQVFFEVNEFSHALYYHVRDF